MLLLLLIFSVCFQNTLLQSLLMKYKIPFDYLITRNSSNFAISVTHQPIFKDSQWLSAFCQNVDCFAAVFNDSTGHYYQLLRNIPNDGSVVDGSYGLKFDESNYLYSIAFLKKNAQNVCLKQPPYFNYTKPKCPNGWFEFIRSNGRPYCYFITGPMSRKEGLINCPKMSKGANVSGFQTLLERNFLHVEIFNRTTADYVHIGGERYDHHTCDQWYPVWGNALKTCYSSQFYWYDYIPLSGKAELVQFQYYDNIDGIPVPEPYCLQITRFILDDNDCNSSYPVLCGKYADGK